MIIFFPQFAPDIILLAFCYSINGDLVIMLRACGSFSKMIINHDLRIITKNPKAELDVIQWDLLKQIGNNKKYTGCF